MLDYAAETYGDKVQYRYFTKGTEIGEMTFYNCELLEKVVVPTTIEFIGENAFYYSFNLTVYFRGPDNSTSDWGEDWDGGRPIVWNYTESAE